MIQNHLGFLSELRNPELLLWDNHSQLGAVLPPTKYLAITGDVLVRFDNRGGAPGIK